jgi:hypothetical protein
MAICRSRLRFIFAIALVPERRSAEAIANSATAKSTSASSITPLSEDNRPPSNGWQIEAELAIVGHGGCGSAARPHRVVSTPIPYARLNALRHTRQFKSQSG